MSAFSITISKLLIPSDQLFLLFFHKLLANCRLSSFKEKASIMKTLRGSKSATTFGKIRPTGFVQKKSCQLLQRWDQITGLWISSLTFWEKTVLLACTQHICKWRTNRCLDERLWKVWLKESRKAGQRLGHRKKIKAIAITRQEKFKSKAVF